MSRATSTGPWIWLAFMMALPVSAVEIADAADTINENAFDRCRAIPDETVRLHCFEDMAPEAPKTESSRVQIAPAGSQNSPEGLRDSPLDSQTAPPSLPIAGKWRLIRTANPRDGATVVSIMATAELSGSDPDFAGLVLRCAEPEFDILVFLISPLSPRAQPTVSINGKIFQSSVAPPGTSILLPKAAALFVKEQWRSHPNLSIDVENGGAVTHGFISMAGFDTALPTLVSACATR